MSEGFKIEFPNEKRAKEYSKKAQRTAIRYLNVYNKQSVEKGPHTVISVFSRNKKELEKEANRQIRNIEFNLQLIKRGVQAYPSDDIELINLSNDIQFSLSNIFPAAGFFMGLHPPKQKIKHQVKKYCELTYDHHLDSMLNRLDLLYSLKESLEEMLLHKYAIETIISDVLSKGYPQKLESIKLDDSSLRDLVREYQSLDSYYNIIDPDDEDRGYIRENEQIESDSIIQKKRGRPLDIPQDPIEHRVNVLVSKGQRKEPGYKKFWHHTGRWKGTANKRQIKLRLIEDGLTGDLDESTVRRRIKKALDSIRQK